jgi:hypothetical protein
MATNGTRPRRARRRRRTVVDDPELHARATAALQLLRKGIETDGVLLLSYVVWPTPVARRTAD